MRCWLVLAAMAALSAVPMAWSGDEKLRKEIYSPIHIGEYVLAETERGVSMMRESQPGLYEAIWDLPRADFVVTAGSTALMRVLEPGSNRLCVADIRQPEHPVFTQLLERSAIGSIAAVEVGKSLHVVFTAVENDHERVFYLERVGDAWRAPVGISPAGLPYPRITPAICVVNGAIEIAYAGYDGDDYEIYGVHGDGSTFTPEQRLTDNSGVADIFPRFEDSGATLVWTRNDGSGRQEERWSLGSQEIAPEPQMTGTRPAALPDANTFCGFGDSITEGDTEWGYSQSVRVGYYPTLNGLLSSNYGAAKLANEGSGGEVTAEGLARINSVLGRVQPGYLMIMEGTNDVTRHTSITPETTRDNLAAMVGKCQAANTLPLLGSLIPRGYDTEFDPNNQHTQETNALIRKLFIDQHLAYAEMFDAFMAVPNYRDVLMKDKVHPNDAGFQLMGKVWYDTISKLPPLGTASLAAAQPGSAARVKLQWAANSESDVAGYLIFYGTTPNVYTSVVNAGKSTSAFIDQLEKGKTYYFRLRCYDNKQNVSQMSAEANVAVK